MAKKPRETNSGLEVEKNTMVCPVCGATVKCDLAYGDILAANHHDASSCGKCSGSGSLAKSKSEFLESLTGVRRILVRNIDELTDAIYASLNEIGKGEREPDVMITLWDGRIVEPIIRERDEIDYPLEVHKIGWWHRGRLRKDLLNSLVEEGLSVDVLMQYGESHIKDAFLVKWHIKWTHPEQKKDEVFMGNEFPDTVGLNRYKTRRTGKTPFSRRGDIERYDEDKLLVPIFVKREELMNANLFPCDLEAILYP